MKLPYTSPVPVRIRHKLLDETRAHLKVLTDNELAMRLHFAPADICRIRRGANMTSELFLSIHEETNWSFEHIRNLAEQSKEAQLCES